MKLKHLVGGLRIDEVMDTRIPVDRWYQDGSSLVGDINIDNEDYQIIIDSIHYPIDGSIKTAINVAFNKVINGKVVHTLTYDTKSSSKVFGAILNAVMDKINQYHYDAVVFGATNDIEKRMKLYNHIARWLSKQYGQMIPNIKIGNGLMTIVCKYKTPDDEIELIKNHFGSK